MPIPEVIRGSAPTLGVQSVNPAASVEVIWTNTWFDPAVEKQAALELLNKGCDVMSRHQDTTAPRSPPRKSAFAIGYNSPPTAPLRGLSRPPPLQMGDFLCRRREPDSRRNLDQPLLYWEGFDKDMVALDESFPRLRSSTAERSPPRRPGIVDSSLKISAVPRQSVRRGEGFRRFRHDGRRNLEHELVCEGSRRLHSQLISPPCPRFRARAGRPFIPEFNS